MTNLKAKELVKEINNISSYCTLIGIKSRAGWCRTRPLDKYLDSFRSGETYTTLLRYISDSGYNADVIAAVHRFVTDLIKGIADFTCTTYDEIKNRSEVRELLKEFGWVEEVKRIPDLGQAAAGCKDTNSAMAEEVKDFVKYLEEIENASPEDKKTAISQLEEVKARSMAIFDQLIDQMTKQTTGEENDNQAPVETVDAEVVQEPEEEKDKQDTQKPADKKDPKPATEKGNKKPEKPATKKQQKVNKQQNNKNQQPVKEQYTAEEAIAETPLGGKLFSPANTAEDDNEVYTGDVEGVPSPA